MFSQQVSSSEATWEGKSRMPLGSGNVNMHRLICLSAFPFWHTVKWLVISNIDNEISFRFFIYTCRLRERYT